MANLADPIVSGAWETFVHVAFLVPGRLAKIASPLASVVAKIDHGCL